MGADGVRLLPATATPVKVSCGTCTSRAGSIFCCVNEGCTSELDHLRRMTIHPAGSLVFLSGEQPRGVFCVGAGRVKLWRSSPDGQSLILGIATSGDVLGVRPLLLGVPHDLSAEAIEPTRLCFIPRNAFLDYLKHNGDVSLRLAEKLSAELGAAYRQVCGVVLKPTLERLTELLLSLGQVHGEPVSAGMGSKVNIGQDELAELAGVSRRSLNRALAALRDKSLIECKRRFIIIHDLTALQKCLPS